MSLLPQTEELLGRLGYLDARGFLTTNELSNATEHAHIFRRAVNTLDLAGVYALRPQTEGTTTPLVYVASADSAVHADRIHRYVWNQNIVPFVLIQTPQDGTRLYAGFRYSRKQKTKFPNLITVVERLSEVASELRSLSAASIQSGAIWRDQRDVIDPHQRVDWKLLKNLEAVGQRLTSGGMDKHVAHALIGKFVYLRYLRDRDILTDGRLAEWGLSIDEVLGRSCSKDAFRHLLTRLDEWLNGSVFPLDLGASDAPSEEDVQYVASVFKGDDVGTGQIHLDFHAYDFSYIPIETLSVIYEQFLNIEGRQRSLGAYYTPIPIVNYMLAEVDDHVPLANGTRVLDPSCGSGAFLVQCYRRIVERELLQVGEDVLQPERLRELLISNVFGVDKDIDACRVTELSLILTLLDYVSPPDLSGHPNFKLPALGETNIFTADFLDPESQFKGAEAAAESFDVIVGNPPWVPLKKKKEYEVALTWVTKHSKTHPIAKMQLAECFAWECLDHLAADGVAGLILPTISLFRASDAFRRSFFQQVQTHSVSDFTNLREVLFAGRGREPAMTLVFGHVQDASRSNQTIVFSPLVINQEANRPQPGSRLETWNLIVNSSELSFANARRDDFSSATMWKQVCHGTRRDINLIEGVRRRYPSIKDLEKTLQLQVSEGPRLRSLSTATEEVIPAPEFSGQRRLIIEELTRHGKIFVVPEAAKSPIPAELDSVPVGRKDRALSVCRPPHIILSVSRAIAIFSDEFLVSRQVGIAGTEEQRNLLIALTLFLNSDFLIYWEFFTSAQSGTRGTLGTLKSLRTVPCPIRSLDEDTLARWLELHGRLVENSHKRLAEWSPNESGFFEPSLNSEVDQEHDELMAELNEEVYDALELCQQERWLVEDFIQVKLPTTEGKTPAESVRVPTEAELEQYTAALRGELNSFLRRDAHTVTVVCGQHAGLVAIGLDKYESEVPNADTLDRVFRELHAQSGQWLYFDRNLLVFHEGWSYYLKPAQRFWWTRTQALLDADRLIAQSIGGR